MADGALEILSPAKLESFRRAARRRAKEHYSADRIIPIYESFYREVLARS